MDATWMQYGCVMVDGRRLIGGGYNPPPTALWRNDEREWHQMVGNFISDIAFWFYGVDLGIIHAVAILLDADASGYTLLWMWVSRNGGDSLAIDSIFGDTLHFHWAWTVNTQRGDGYSVIILPTASLGIPRGEIKEKTHYLEATWRMGLLYQSGSIPCYSVGCCLETDTLEGQIAWLWS